MANKTLLVAQREYLENVRTKTFWIGIFIVPVLLAGLVGVSVLLQKLREVQRYSVVDLGGGELMARAEREFRAGDARAMWRIAQQMKDDPALAGMRQGGGADGEPTGEQMTAVLDWAARQDPTELAKLGDLGASKRFTLVSPQELGVIATAPEDVQRELSQRVHKGELFAYFVLGADPDTTVDDFRYVSNNFTDDALRRGYEAALTRIVQRDRITAAGIAPKVAAHIQQQVACKQLQADSAGGTTVVKKENVVDQWAPVGFVYFLWMAILGVASMLLTNTVEEKSNRIIEVLLSSVSPGQLMQGKIWGIAATGMTMVFVWILFALAAAWTVPQLLGMSGGGVIVGVFKALQNSGYLLSFAFYFLAGYLLYAAILVAIGAACNTLKEAQNLTQPVMMTLMIPMLSMVFIGQEPNGTVAKVLSWIPFFTPFTMMNRAGGPPATWEYVGTSVLLLVTIWLTMRAAGKIFRVGVLMTGNPPKLKEILGWLRQS
jgi:ABC-2 type transport system permease protein